MAYHTKPGKYGTLYLFEISYHDKVDKYNQGVSKVWAYDAEHAEMKFYDADVYDMGWEIESIRKARAKV